MSDIVIKAKNISKRYRIGVKEKSDTFAGQLKSLLAAPFRNFKQIKNLNQFSNQEDESVFWALKDINFDVKRGEVLGIIGHNGAGKSTLLKILSRITEPTTGEIMIKGRVSSLLEVGTGFHPELTGRDNIYMNGTILGMTKKEIDAKLEEIVEFSGVAKHLDTPVKFYSSGMKVRLAFSVAAHLEPEILIIDEVLAVGDAEFQKKCLGKMESVAGEGRTVLFVSHNMASVEALCSSAILLEKGLVVFSGKGNEVIDKYLKSKSVRNKFRTLHEIKDRKGSGELTFYQYSFLNEAEDTINILKTGMNFYFEIELKVSNKIKNNLYLNVGIDNSKGQRIALFSNELTGEDLKLKKRNEDFWYVRIYIPKNPFKKGTYNFTLFLKSTSGIIDWVIDAGYFEVEMGDYFGTGRTLPFGQCDLILNHNFK